MHMHCQIEAPYTHALPWLTSLCRAHPPQLEMATESRMHPLYPRPQALVPPGREDAVRFQVLVRGAWLPTGER